MCERGILFTEETELLCIIKYKGSNNKVLILYKSTIKEENVPISSSHKFLLIKKRNSKKMMR